MVLAQCCLSPLPACGERPIAERSEGNRVRGATANLSVSAGPSPGSHFAVAQCSPPSPAKRERELTPHLLRQLHDHSQLRPLLVLGEDVAFFCRGEAALRRKAELVEGDVFRRL